MYPTAVLFSHLAPAACPRPRPPDRPRHLRRPSPLARPAQAPRPRPAATVDVSARHVDAKLVDAPARLGGAPSLRDPQDNDGPSRRG
eukprot:3470500-Prymnesium_polylepis.1